MSEIKYKQKNIPLFQAYKSLKDLADSKYFKLVDGNQYLSEKLIRNIYQQIVDKIAILENDEQTFASNVQINTLYTQLNSLYNQKNMPSEFYTLDSVRLTFEKMSDSKKTFEMSYPQKLLVIKMLSDSKCDRQVRKQFWEATKENSSFRKDFLISCVNNGCELDPETSESVLQFLLQHKDSCEMMDVLLSFTIDGEYGDIVPQIVGSFNEIISKKYSTGTKEYYYENLADVKTTISLLCLYVAIVKTYDLNLSDKMYDKLISFVGEEHNRIIFSNSIRKDYLVFDAVIKTFCYDNRVDFIKKAIQDFMRLNCFDDKYYIIYRLVYSEKLGGVVVNYLCEDAWVDYDKFISNTTSVGYRVRFFFDRVLRHPSLNVDNVDLGRLSDNYIASLSSNPNLSEGKIREIYAYTVNNMSNKSSNRVTIVDNLLLNKNCPKDLFTEAFVTLSDARASEIMCEYDDYVELLTHEDRKVVLKAAKAASVAQQDTETYYQLKSHPYAHVRSVAAQKIVDGYQDMTEDNSSIVSKVALKRMLEDLSI